MTNSYSAELHNIFWPHGRNQAWFFYDRAGSSPNRDMEMRTQVESGDYFVTLATRLDCLSESVEKKDKVASKQLQSIIRDLLYLQSYYSVTKKPPSG